MENIVCINCCELEVSCTCGANVFLSMPGTMTVIIRILFSKGYDVIDCSEGSVFENGALFVLFSNTYDFEVLPVGFEYAFEVESGTSMVVNNIHLKLEQTSERQRTLINSMKFLLNWVTILPNIS